MDSELANSRLSECAGRLRVFLEGHPLELRLDTVRRLLQALDSATGTNEVLGRFNRLLDQESIRRQSLEELRPLLTDMRAALEATDPPRDAVWSYHTCERVLAACADGDGEYEMSLDDRAHFYSSRQLWRRGWTDPLRKRLLREPDSKMKRARPLFTKERVTALEETPEVVVARKREVARREKTWVHRSSQARALLDSASATASIRSILFSPPRFTEETLCRWNVFAIPAHRLGSVQDPVLQRMLAAWESFDSCFMRETPGQRSPWLAWCHLAQDHLDWSTIRSTWPLACARIIDIFRTQHPIWSDALGDGDTLLGMARYCLGADAIAIDRYRPD